MFDCRQLLFIWFIYRWKSDAWRDSNDLYWTNFKLTWVFYTILFIVQISFGYHIFSSLSSDPTIAQYLWSWKIRQNIFINIIIRRVFSSQFIVNIFIAHCAIFRQLFLCPWRWDNVNHRLTVNTNMCFMVFCLLAVVMETIFDVAMETFDRRPIVTSSSSNYSLIRQLRLGVRWSSNLDWVFNVINWDYR